MSRLAVADPPNGSTAPRPRGLTTAHVWAVTLVFGFAALLMIFEDIEPVVALLLGLGGLAGTMVITSAGSAARTMLQGLARVTDNNNGTDRSAS